MGSVREGGERLGWLVRLFRADAPARGKMGSPEFMAKPFPCQIGEIMVIAYTYNYMDP